MGRDVGRDEGREQAEWRDLVARLELQAPIDPADAPWPDRENLRTKTQPGTVSPSGGTDPASQPATGQPATGQPTDGQPADGQASQVLDDQAPDGEHNPGEAGPEAATGDVAVREESDDGDSGRGGRGSADRSRIIRPAGFTRFGERIDSTGATDSDPTGTGDTEANRAEANRAEASLSQASGTKDEPAATGGADDRTIGGPRDYGLDEPSDDDLAEDWDDRYIPPPLPPQPGLDPVAKGAWLALFGGPGYLLIATLLSWQISGWAALTAVIAFVAGFVVLVFRLGDGPSKRDGPDQGAVV